MADLQVPGSVRLLLDLCADGVRLTPGGRLPRSLVRQVQAARPTWSLHPDRPAWKEEDLLPLPLLYDALRHARLLRPVRGVLAPTRAGRDDQQVQTRLREVLFDEDDIGGAVRRWVLERLLERPAREDQLERDAVRSVARGWGTEDGRPLDPVRVRQIVAYAGQLLVGVDALEESGPFLDRTWHVTLTGRGLLGR